jgi:LAO/AO transport system kinase
MELVDKVLKGDRLALARLLTQVENDSPQGRAALNELFAHTGHAHLIGITGSPGTGKSSLANQLAKAYRQPASGAPLRVAVVAVDPSSPFTGGALLGDRVRMRDLAGDPGVFIRSMASRGSLGGLARATAGAVQALDAAGFDIILIETVGAGQSEVDIARLAHTTIVVEAPGLGDDIQASKAGILEIADILVVNKGDRPGVETTLNALRSMLEMAMPMQADEQHWNTPVLRTVAASGEGVHELVQAIAAHRRHLLESGEWQARESSRLRYELTSLLQSTLMERWQASLPADLYDTTLERLLDRSISPHQAVRQLLDRTDNRTSSK